jgi:DNA helicase-2/ATP-dependent DNA helicase PcrA
LPQFVEELRVISGNERRFIGFDDAEAGYEPKPGIVTVATMHAAKGLEWDRVYLMAVSNYGFPSVLPYDSYIGEKWYVRGSADSPIQHLNLEAEALAQLEALAARSAYVEGDATLGARVDYAKERLRLLYVGITRARRELIVTWNMGRFWQKGREYENQPALPLVMLGEYVERGL